MEGATAVSQKARLRQQILDGEQDIEALSGKQQQFSPQGYQYGGQFQNGPQYDPQFQQSNYDLMTPLPVPAAPSSRKGSLTSQSALRLFRRNKGGGTFDDDTGADISDLTIGNVSFDDITHIRDQGPYVHSSKPIDTTPIIPTLGTGLSNPAKLNNVQYRKQMNHQKKAALASGARAMSLASGGNPMQPQQQFQGGDPRAMSMTAPGYRAMSLNSNPNGPRTMSLNNRGSNFPPPGPGYQGGPPPMGYGMHMGGPMGPNAPRAGSMRAGGNPMFPAPNGYAPHGNGPRAMSLNTNSQNPYFPQQHPKGPQIPQVQSFPNNLRVGPPGTGGHPSLSPQPNQFNNNHFGQNRGNEYGFANGQSPTPPGPAAPAGQMPYQSQNYNDSLMNVVEEEEEGLSSSPSVKLSQAPNRQPQPNASSEASTDEVAKYQFSEDDASLSRKSTLKKSNSVKLRKINLFSNDEVKEEDDNTAVESPVRPNNDDHTSPSFNIRQTNNNRESMVNEDDDQSDGEKFKSLGASANKEVFVTAPNFHTPHKNESTSKASSKSSYNDGFSAKERGSPENNEAWSLKKRSVSIQSLVANTAFSNFRNGEVNSIHKEDLEENDNNGKLSHPSSDKSSTYRDNFEGSSPSTENTSNASTFQNPYGNDDVREASSANLVNVPYDETGSAFNEDLKSSGSKKDKTRRFSLTGKSKNLFKRLSKSGKRGSVSQNGEDDDEISSQSGRRSSNASFTTKIPAQSSGQSSVPASTPKPTLHFTKEELGIMNSNSELLNELQLVTTELASSIKRELNLETRLKNGFNHTQDSDLLNNDDDLKQLNSSKIIADLQEKLNKERRLRFISEEHALLLENGQAPSPLKLNYEKTEIYQQLLVKNDLINQLEDKLQEKDKNTKTDRNLLDKYNELLKENAELKFTVIPDLEKRLAAQSVSSQNNTPSKMGSNRQLSLVSDGFDESYDESQEAIVTLKSQREELREVVSKLTSSHNFELKNCNDKIKALEAKLSDMKTINDKLSRRLNHSEESPESSAMFSAPKGGKLNGFTIVSPIKKMFDD